MDTKSVLVPPVAVVTCDDGARLIEVRERPDGVLVDVDGVEVALIDVVAVFGLAPLPAVA